MVTKKLIDQRLTLIKEVEADLNDLSYKLNLYCQKCPEDRIFCQACAIPLSRFKIEHIFIKKIR
jgi:hypothetical protein